MDVETNPEVVLPLPPDDATFGYRYPVVQYDHDEGRAIAGGMVYRGTVAALDGKFVFGDLVNGRIFYADLDEMLAAADGDPATTAQIYELNLEHDGQPATLLEVVADALGLGSVSRTDLRFGQDADGEIYVTTKQDGFVRKLVPIPLTALPGLGWPGLVTLVLLLVVVARVKDRASAGAVFTSHEKPDASLRTSTIRRTSA